jgi:excisionase family DNA binding protein
MTQLLSTKEAAKMLLVSPRTIQDWRVKGGGPAYVRISGNRVVYRLADLEDWIEARVFQSTSAETLP